MLRHTIRHIPRSVPLLVFMAPLLAGCLPSTSEGPQRLFPIADETSAIRQTIGTPDLFNTSETYRNTYITGRMYAIDLAYFQYEAALTHERQDVNFAADAINIGLTSSVPLVTATATKNILGAAAAGLTGIRSSYNNDILLSRTIQILQTQMRASRAQVAARILTNLKRSTEAYPLSVALSDLEDYYRAGTISGALLSVNAAVANDATLSQGERAAAIRQSIIRNASAPIPAPYKGKPQQLSGDNRYTFAEEHLRIAQIKKIQKMVCAKADGRLGPHGSDTRIKISEFMKSKNPARPPADTISWDERATLLDAVDKGEQVPCK